MIQKRYAITTDASQEIDLLLARFESDRGMGPVDLADYLPALDDPAYNAVVTELARIDLEHCFESGAKSSAAKYIDRFPQVFSEQAYRTQLAFEEYRLRRWNGEDVSATDVASKYKIDGSRWPELALGSANSKGNLPSLRFENNELAVSVVRYPRVGETFAGHPLIERLGEGAFSRVYLAKQPDLAGRIVVLKVTPLCADESNRLARLQHSSIIPVYSVHREGELSCICMPFVGSTTLADFARSAKRWASLTGPAHELVSTILDRRQSTIGFITEPKLQPPAVSEVSRELDDRQPATETLGLSQYFQLGYVDALLALVTKAVEGLDHAHQRGIIHRDLKPANILISDDGIPILLDFNLAVEKHEVVTRIVGGTLPYMSPQQLAALETGAAADTRDDVFSIGVILYELLSGRLPFDCPGSRDDFDLARVIKKRQRTPGSISSLNKGVSPGLESIISRCIAPERSNRYQNATELLDDLNRHRQHLPLLHAPNRNIKERFRKWTVRHPRLSSATTVAALAIGILILCSALIYQRGERISRINVESKFEQLQMELPTAIAALSVPDHDPDMLSVGILQSTELLAQWHVGSGHWEQLSDIHRLDNDSQDRLRRQLGKLAYSVADAEFHRARQADESRQTEYGENSRHWNQLVGVLDPRLQRLAQYQSEAVSRKLSGGTGKPAKRSVHADEDLDLRAMWAQQTNDLVLWQTLSRMQLDEQPTNSIHWMNLAIASHRLGDLQAAAIGFEMCNRFHPGSISTLLHRGICNLELGRTDSAIDDFTACLDINPQALVPRFNRAVSLHRISENVSALRDLDQLINDGHLRTRIVLMRARVHNALGNHDEANSDRVTALTIAPRDANDWVARGVSRLADEPQKSLVDFASALQIDANHYDALRNSAHVYADVLKTPERAIRILDQMILAWPNRALPFASRGIMRGRISNWELAISDAQAASQLQPTAREQLQIAGIYALLINRVDSTNASSAKETKQLALHWLKRSLRKDPSLAKTAARDPDLVSLRSENSFRALIGSAMTLD